MRDDFNNPVKEILAKRVAYICSNPDCRKPTIGPNSDKGKITNIGVAAHITAASEGGPRFDNKLSVEERRSHKNGIWLCQTCSKLIDSDVSLYTTEVLNYWKENAEKQAFEKLALFPKNSVNDIIANKIKLYEKLFYEINDANSIVLEVMKLTDISADEKKSILYYVGLQIADFTDKNSFYLNEEITVQTVGMFVGLQDLFYEDSSINQKIMDEYNKNFRAAYKLLKSVDIDGNINTDKKTPLMQYFCRVRDEQEKKDYL